MDHQLIQSIGAIATAMGVGIAAFQLWRAKQQATTAFEDDMAREYRSICKNLPTRVFFGESLSTSEMAGLLDDFYSYFDLSNSQVFFRQSGRVSENTWNLWAAGMRANLSLAAFSMAWSQIGPRVGTSFHEYKKSCRRAFRERSKTMVKDAWTCN